VALDKNEGPVKQKLSLVMPEHRFVGHRTLSTEDTGKRPDLNHPSVKGFAVSPTIDSAQLIDSTTWTEIYT
jgi:hypothetical protein